MPAVTHPLLAVLLPAALLAVLTPILLFFGLKRGVSAKVIAFEILLVGLLAALINGLLLRF